MVLKTSPTASGVVVWRRMSVKAFLQLGRNWVFQPKKMVGLQLLAQTGCFYGSEPVVNIVQQIQIVAQRLAQRLEELGNMAQILLCGPQALRRQAAFGRLIVLVILRDAIRRLEPRNSALGANGGIAHLPVALYLVHGLCDVAPGSMGIDQDMVAALAAEQVVDRDTERLALDVPKRHIDGRDGGHGNRPSPPVRTAIEIMPDVFSLKRIAPDQARNEVILQIADDCQLASIQGRIAQAVDALVGFDFQGHEIAARTADNHFRAENFHLLVHSAGQKPAIDDQHLSGHK